MNKASIRPNLVSRLIPVRNGMTQLVALQPKYWECLEWMITVKGLELDQITDFCVNFTKEFPEDDFATAFEHSIYHYMMLCIEEQSGKANDNAPDLENAQ